jgi:hypothetical protein
MPSHELWLTDDKGTRITDNDGRTIISQLSFSATKAVNSISPLVVELPPSFDDSLLVPDRMIQVWRAPTGGKLGLWQVYFIRRWKFQTRQNSESLTVWGVSPEDLLRRRIVAAFAGSTQAAKTDYADDMMKEVVAESIADGVSPTPDAGTRVWSDLSIAADLSDGPTITRSFPYDPLLMSSGRGVLGEIAKAAKIEGTEVFFDVVPDVITNNSISFEFRTYTGQPRQDVTEQVTFDKNLGNLTNISLEYDYTDEINYVYAGGQEEGAARNVQQVYDTDRYNISQWNRCEGFADARNQTTDNGVIAAGNAELKEGEPKIKYSATPKDTRGTRFGRDWDFGYRVRSKYRNREFDTIVRAVTLSVDDKGEDIKTKLEYEN